MASSDKYSGKQLDAVTVQSGQDGPDFGIYLAGARPQPDLSGADRQTKCDGSSCLPQIVISNEGTIGKISFPSGWTEETFPVASDGTNVIKVKDGKTFVPPEHNEEPNVRLHLGYDLDSPVPEVALKQLLKDKPATGGEQTLTADEIKSVASVIRPYEGGNNQYQNLGPNFPEFDLTDAKTVSVNGETVLMIKGKFKTGSLAGQERESIYIDSPSSPGHIEQLNLTAPPDKMSQYEKQLWNTARSIQWKDK